MSIQEAEGDNGGDEGDGEGSLGQKCAGSAKEAGEDEENHDQGQDAATASTVSPLEKCPPGRGERGKREIQAGAIEDGIHSPSTAVSPMPYNVTIHNAHAANKLVKGTSPTPAEASWNVSLGSPLRRLL